MARTAKKSRAKKENPEVVAAIKLFKASGEVESFYQFVHENNLRNEANILIKMVLKTLTPAKRKKKMLQ
jgi:hypothetical protein